MSPNRSASSSGRSVSLNSSSPESRSARPSKRPASSSSVRSVSPSSMESGFRSERSPSPLRPMSPSELHYDIKAIKVDLVDDEAALNTAISALARYSAAVRTAELSLLAERAAMRGFHQARSAAEQGLSRQGQGCGKTGRATPSYEDAQRRLDAANRDILASKQKQVQLMEALRRKSKRRRLAQSDVQSRELRKRADLKLLQDLQSTLKYQADQTSRRARAQPEGQTRHAKERSESTSSTESSRSRQSRQSLSYTDAVEKARIRAQMRMRSWTGKTLPALSDALFDAYYGLFYMNSGSLASTLKGWGGPDGFRSPWDEVTGSLDVFYKMKGDWREMQAKRREIVNKLQKIFTTRLDLERIASQEQAEEVGTSQAIRDFLNQYVMPRRIR